jgi:hypothetical protein
MIDAKHPYAPGPRNLLNGDWTAEAVADVLSCHPARPLLPPIDSAPWHAVVSNPVIRDLLTPLREMAEKECAEPLPLLTDALYADFVHTGVRLTFERVYFERRRRLARAAVSYLLCGEADPWRGRLESSTLNKLEEILDEVSWALPAHVNWDNNDPSGKDPMQIDLFCAETANLMAEMLDVFGERIPAALQQRMNVRLEGIFDRYLEHDFHWMEVTHNWNAVCHQGVVGAALSRVRDPLRLAAILMRAREKLPNFLAGFSADGGCSEGLTYWGYGFGWFAVLNEQLETRSDGELSLFEGDEHIRRIAEFGPRMVLAGGHLVNFSDGEVSGGLRPSLLSYLGDRLDEPDCRAASMDAYSHLVRVGIKAGAERADLFYLLRLLLRFPAGLPAERSRPPEDCFLPDLAVLVARGKDAQGNLWEFAAKGGHNGEHHNHNDCGSFLLNINAQRLITEIGAPEYVHDFFGPKRYGFLAARSLGHSVPLVNGFEQRVGVEFAAKVLACDIGGEWVDFVIDLTSCYPAEARCRKLVRRIRWNKPAGRIQIADDFEFDEPGILETFLICEAPIERRDRDVFIQDGGLSLRVIPDRGTSYAGNEVCAYRGKLGEEQSINRLRFRCAAPALSGSVAFSIVLQDGRKDMSAES